MTDRKHTTHEQQAHEGREGRRGAGRRAAAVAGEPPRREIAEAAAQAIADELAVVTRERDEYLDHLRRLKAEFDNYRKRVQRDNEALRLRAAEAVVESLLPVMDNMSRALEAGDRHEEGQLAGRPRDWSPTSCAARWPVTASRRSRSSRARRSTRVPRGDRGAAVRRVRRGHRDCRCWSAATCCTAGCCARPRSSWPGSGRRWPTSIRHSASPRTPRRTRSRRRSASSRASITRTRTPATRPPRRSSRRSARRTRRSPTPRSASSTTR